MRIAILSQTYLPIHGGIAEHVHHTALELRRRGHDVKVITTYFDRSDEYFDEDVIRLGHDLTLPMNGAFVNMTVGFRLGKQLARIEEEHHFDLIHIHAPLEPMLPLAALRTFRAPMVGTFHSFANRSFLYEVLHGWARWYYASRLSARIAVSEAAKSFISKYFPGDYRIIPNGVDVNRFSPDVEPIKKFNDDRPTILFVGRMDPRKGLKYLLQAFPQVLKECPDARLVVVGGGILTRYYKRFVKEEIRKNIFFEGFASGENLPKYFATADVCCSPATGSESFGIVLIEALAAGKPVVAFDNRGYHDVVGTDGSCGTLVPTKDIHALARELTRILKDKDLRQRMGVAARQKALRYSWVKVTDEIEEVYQSVLHQREA